MIIELFNNLAQGIGLMVKALWQAGVNSAYVIRQTFRAHFNLIGRYTAPIEQEFLNKTPPELSRLNFNVFGQIALTIIPVTILSWLLSLTLGPLLYNSAYLFVVGLLRATNLALPTQTLSIPKPPDHTKLNWVRRFFGLPGFLLGGVLGLGAAAVIGLIRVVFHSFKTAAYAFAFVTNLALVDFETKDKIKGPNLDKMEDVEKYGFGLPGFFFGGLVGGLGFTLVGLVRVLTNSLKTVKGLTVSALNAVCETKFEGGLGKDGRGELLTYGLGFPGFIIGSLIAALSVIAVQSWETTKELFNAIVNLAPEEYPTESSAKASPKPKERSLLSYYIPGAPGLVAGFVAGSLGFMAIVAKLVIVHSIKTARRTFFSLVNFGLDEEHTREDWSLQGDQRVSHPRLVYGFGSLGFIAGAVVGVVGLFTVVLGRAITNTYETAKRITVAGVNLVLHDGEEQIPLTADKRSAKLKYGLGFFGIPLGIITAGLGLTIRGIGRFGIESWKSGKMAFKALGKEARSLEESPEESPSKPKSVKTSKKDRLFVDKWIFGAPGVFLGGVLGGLNYARVVLALILIHSYESAKRSFASITNVGLHPNHRIKDLELSKDKRKAKLIFGFGSLGVLLGGLAGIIGGFFIFAVARNSFEIAKRMTVSALHAVGEGTEWQGLQQYEGSTVLQYLLGFPGFLIGGITGTMAVTVVGLKRTFTESWKSGREFFKTLVERALPVDSKFEELTSESIISDESKSKERTAFQRYVWGGPGVFFGIVLGSVASTLIIAGRVIWESLKTARSLTASAINLVTYEDEKFDDLEKDERLPHLKYVFGSPGLVLGIAPAFLGLVLAGLRRSAIESLRTTTAVFKVMFNASIDLVAAGGAKAVEDNEAFDQQSQVGHHADEQPSPSKPKKRGLLDYILGAPGLVVGVAAGGFTFAAIIVGHVIINSVKTAQSSFFSLVNLGLAPGWERKDLALESDPRANYPKLIYGFGALGFIPGVAAGLIGLLTVGLERIIANSCETAMRLTVAGANFVFPEPIIKLGEDTRLPAPKYLGTPGYVIGMITVPPAMVLAVIIRTVVESIKTAWQIGTAISIEADLDLGTKAGKKAVLALEMGVRSPVDLYGFGALGVLLGLIFGGMVFIKKNIERLIDNIVIHSIETGGRAFGSLVNLGFDEDVFSSQLEGADDKRSWPEKYLLGFPGLAVGGAAGLFVLAIIETKKLIINTIYSWLNLSGSLLNGGLSLPVFSGLKGDNRPNHEKIIGGLGYLAAIVTTLPLALLIFTFKTGLPVIVALLLGVISSPFVAAMRAFSKEPSKEEKIAEPDQSAEVEEVKKVVGQKFKNIYSSLTPWGELPEGGDIKENQNGHENSATSARKAITFGFSSVTERVLADLSTGFSLSADKAKFFTEEGGITEILNKTEDNYNSVGCLEPAHDVRVRSKEIKKVGWFVRNYIAKDSKGIPPDLYSKQKNSWSAIFWGARQNSDKVQDNVDLEFQSGGL